MLSEREVEESEKQEDNESSSTSCIYHINPSSIETRWKELMSPDTLELIISYLEEKHRMVIELVCLDLRMACLSVERRDFLAIFKELNDEDLILRALNEEPVDEEEISNFETRMPGFKLDFYTRELLKKTNGRMDWTDSLFHPVNIIAPIQEWTKDFGYLYYKNKSQILNLLQMTDFNFVHECLVCIGSASQKICWGSSKFVEYNPSLSTGSVSQKNIETSEELEYNPFHTRVRKLYADKNFNLYDLEYMGFENYSFNKLGNMKKWFKSLLPQQKLNLKIVPKREPIRFATEEKKNDPEFVLKYLRNNGSQLKYVSKELRNNRDIVCAAVSNYLDAIQYASDEIKDDEIFMKDILLMHPLTVRFCSERVKGTEIAQETIRSKPFRMEEMPTLSVVEFIPKSIIENKEYALNMIQKTCNTYLSLSDNLKEDRDICLEAVKNGLCISKISPLFKDDKEIALSAVKSSYRKYEFISERLKKDRDIVLTTFKNITYSFSATVPFEVSDDKSLILESITSNNTLILFNIISDRLKSDKEVALKLVFHDRGSLYKSLPESLKVDVEVLTTTLNSMIQKGGTYFSNFDYIPDQTLYLFCHDYPKALLLLQVHTSAFPLISPKLRSNKQFILELLSLVRNFYGQKLDLSCVDKSLLLDEDVLMKLANNKYGVELLKILPKDVYLSDNMIQHLVMTNPATISYVHQTPDLVMTALSQGYNCSPSILSMIKEEILTLEMVIIALQHMQYRWIDVPEKFTSKENIIKILTAQPKLYVGLDFYQKRDIDFIKLAITEPTNFKIIPYNFLTSELVVKALQHNTPADIEKYIYLHLPTMFMKNEEVYNLLKEKIPHLNNLQ